MTPSIVKTYDGDAARDTTSESVSEIAASISSRLARSRDGGAPFDETQQPSVSVLNEVNCVCDNARVRGKCRAKSRPWPSDAA